MSSPTPYQLAFALHGHSSDVRNLCAPSPGLPLLLSGSRDGSAIVWGPSPKGGEGGEWDVKLRVEGPEKRFVSCVGMARWNGEGELAFPYPRMSSGMSSSLLTGRLVLRGPVDIHASLPDFSSAPDRWTKS